MNTPKPSDTFDWLTHQWIVAGIVSASARFIPVPFVDDVVRDQCRKFVVSRTLASHESDVSLDRLKPYYFSSGGCLGGCTSMVVKAPLKLLLFPIRKIALVLTSVREVPMEVMRMVLLGRTLDRYLRDGKLAGDAQQSAKMRAAFEESFARMDWRVIKAAMADALSSVGNWKPSATESARQVAGRRKVASEGFETSKDVEAGAQKIQDILDRPETLRLFAEFDRRFDDLMKT
jgi:hypothetical protein